MPPARFAATRLFPLPLKGAREAPVMTMDWMSVCLGIHLARLISTDIYDPQISGASQYGAFANCTVHIFF